MRTVTGRTIVVHDSSSARVACGLIQPYAVSEAGVVRISRYPNYMGPQDVWGLFLQRPSGAMGVDYKGVVAGLVPNDSISQWHVHVGVSCEEDYGVGTHYYLSLIHI